MLLASIQNRSARAFGEYLVDQVSQSTLSHFNPNHPVLFLIFLQDYLG